MSFWRFKIVCMAVPLPAVTEAVPPGVREPCEPDATQPHLSRITDQGTTRVFDGSGLAA